MLTPVILSGGAGTRLWPLSRELYPKQLLALTGERTMIQQTALRLEGLAAAGPVVVCNEAHRFLVAEQLRQLAVAPQAIVLEPAGRNTAPAIALAAHAALKAAGPKAAADPLLLVLPADHVIRDVPAFHKAVHSALRRRPAGAARDFRHSAHQPGDRVWVHTAGSRERRGVSDCALRREARRRGGQGSRRHRRLLLEQRHVPVRRPALPRGAGTARARDRERLRGRRSRPRRPTSISHASTSSCSRPARATRSTMR